MNRAALRITTLLAANALLPVSAETKSSTANSTMTNIVTMVDACDIVAIGLDFGLTTGVFQQDVNSVTANTAMGSILNSSHPLAAADGGEGNDDELQLNVPGNNGPIANALTELLSDQPGVFVACTAEPISILVSGFYGDTSLSTRDVSTSLASLQSAMQRVSSNGRNDQIDYQLTFSQHISSSVSPDTALFTGSYHAAGLISANTNSSRVSAGYYADTTVATLTF